MASQLEVTVNGKSVDNPVRKLAQIFAYCAAVLSDPEVLETSDQFFGAMNRAARRYELALDAPPSTRAIEAPEENGRTDDDR